MKNKTTIKVISLFARFFVAKRPIDNTITSANAIRKSQNIVMITGIANAISISSLSLLVTEMFILPCRHSDYF